MSGFLLYSGAALIAGAVVLAAASGFSAFLPRARHWSSLWSMALVVTLSIPICGAMLIALVPEAQLVTAIGEAAAQLDAVWDRTLFAGPGDANTENGWMAGLADQLPLMLATIYCAGLAIMLIRLAIGRMRAQALGHRADGPHDLGGIRYWLSDEVDTPFAIGSILGGSAHRIIVPVSLRRQLPAESLAMVLKHEQAHIRRDDDRIGFLLRVVVAICWFSPFAHILFTKWSEAAEVQCDAAALEDQSTEMRNAYANTLLTALHIMAGRVRQYPAASFSTHRIRSEKMRIAQIMKGSPGDFKQRGARGALLAAAALATVIGGASVAANGQTSTPAPVVSAQTAPQSVADFKIVEGRITAKFGRGDDPLKQGSTRDHWGLDIAAPVGTPIRAPADGSIVEATNLFDNKPAYGVVVVHRASDGTLTLFAHLEGFTVTPGQSVRAGEQIAMVGNTGRSTGPHVHIETIRDGQRIDPQLVWPVLQ